MPENETKATIGDVLEYVRDLAAQCDDHRLQEAADEIVALRASNEIMRQASEKYNAEIERLRAENAALVKGKAELVREGHYLLERALKAEGANG